jgi:DNA/RNA-binding domain of Phe-tRNA-synthetase-like protein
MSRPPGPAPAGGQPEESDIGRSQPWGGSESADPSEPSPGWCARELEEELPGLQLLSSEVQVGRRDPLTGDSPADIRGRLRELSNRYRGDRAINVRRERIPAAYRIFFRHIGLDPDVVRTPIEAAVLDRMLRGGFLPRGLLADVLLIALIDTGVPVAALDAGSVDGPLGIRSSGEGEHFGRDPGARALPAGRLVVADASTPLAILFGELAPGHEPQEGTSRLVLFAVQVAGVPQLFAEEALWSCRTALEQP